MAGYPTQNKDVNEEGTRPRPSCKDCIIEGMNDLQFLNNREIGAFRLPESTMALAFTAKPSIEDCPCKWDDQITVEYIRIHTGLANQTRRQLFLVPQLVQTSRARISALPNHVTVNACTLEIKISRINQDLRDGNIGGTSFNFKAVPLRVGARVRCNGKWRKLMLEITDN